MAKDNFHRKIDYLRISVTDRCNLRCVYCMPPEGINLLGHDEVLSYEEIIKIVRAAVKAGLTRIRITGGEPLVRKDIPQLISEISATYGVRDLSLTTNGVYLAKLAEPLYVSGLRRLNISLDTLNPERYLEITRGGDLSQVLEGIDKALEVGFNPVKINTVAIKGVVEEELERFKELVYAKPVHVRFIEKMDLGGSDSQDFYSCKEIMEKVSKATEIEETEGPIGAGPARYIKLKGTRGTIGFIGLYSEHFCDSCNRLRLTADGKLRTCLFAGEEFDLKTFIRDGASEEEIVGFIEKALKEKPENFKEALKSKGKRAMRQIGG